MKGTLTSISMYISDELIFSDSMQNITVTALKKDKVVENHTCTFDLSGNNVFNHYPTYDGYKIYDTEMDQIQCGKNVTKLQFKR